MDYIVRRITQKDKEFLVSSGVKSPFGGMPSFGRYLVVNEKKEVKMAMMGGQGVMKEDGTEWSEEAHYAVVNIEGKNYTVEFFSYSKCVDKSNGYETFIIIYKIKEIKSLITVNSEKMYLLNIVKECFVAYGAGGCKTSLCKDVIFIDEEVRWT
ncbi:MAG: hypothetical protein IKJ15_07625 [Lachnospiraceae bacterium]|nr:hypothetical protein [Lachnospiraceae bacterium]